MPRWAGAAGATIPPTALASTITAAIDASLREFLISWPHFGFARWDGPKNELPARGRTCPLAVYRFPVGSGMGLTGIVKVYLDTPPRPGFSCTVRASSARHTEED